MIHAEALKVAERLIELFQPACERIEIKGSLVRLKPDVKDIDLLLVPDLSPLPLPRAEFGKPVPPVYKTRLDQLLGQMVEDKVIVMEKSGDRLKRFKVMNPFVAVELYSVLPPETWGVKSVIRTGPKDFSHWVVTRKRSGGALPNGYRVQHGAVYQGVTEAKDLSGETPIGFETELDFLNFLGLGWVEPKDRVANWSGLNRSR